MIKVGLTGGIGSGKSLVCEVLMHLGVPIYHADWAAKHLYNADDQLRQQMIALFGANIYTSEGIDRKKLASIIFNNEQAMHAVTQLVYPAIGNDFKKWVLQQHAPYVVQEAAVLFESGLAGLMDKTISITAPTELRIKRASLRDKVAYAEIERRIANQITDEERNRYADYVITCNDVEPLLPQILRLHQLMMSINNQNE